MKSRKVIISFNDVDSTLIGKIVQTATEYPGTVYLTNGTKKINAKSIMGMMSLVTEDGKEIDLTVDGPDEDEALDRLSAFFK